MNFIAEFQALQKTMPRLGMLQLQCENSTYTFATDQLKNCYLIMNAVKNQNCMYGRDFYYNNDCVDCDHIEGCELCYQCVNCKKCYESAYLQDCENASFCSYGYDLKSCDHCVGCAGLRKKSYCIFNKQYSQQEYMQVLLGLTPEEIQTGFEEVKKTTPRLCLQMMQSEGSVGDYVYRSKNAWSSFDSIDCQDVGYCNEAKNNKDCWDIFILEEASLCYEISSSHQLYNCNFCYMCVGSSDLDLCEFVMYSKNCFGCVGIGHKQYHILNQPYSKEDYEKKVKEIKSQLKAEGMYGMNLITPSYPFEDTVATWARL